MMPIIESQAQRDALIERNKKIIAMGEAKHVTVDEIDLLNARIALAALEAEIVGETVGISRGLQRVTEVAWKGGLVPKRGSKIYTAPPVPVVKPVIFNRGTLAPHGDFVMSTKVFEEMLKEQGFQVDN